MESVTNGDNHRTPTTGSTFLYLISRTTGRGTSRGRSSSHFRHGRTIGHLSWPRNGPVTTWPRRGTDVCIGTQCLQVEPSSPLPSDSRVLTVPPSILGEVVRDGREYTPSCTFPGGPNVSGGCTRTVSPGRGVQGKGGVSPSPKPRQVHPSVRTGPNLTERNQVGPDGNWRTVHRSPRESFRRKYRIYPPVSTF